MKLLMTADCVGGVWTYALELCRALGRHGVQVDLAIQGGPLKDDQREDVRALPNVVPHESSLKLEWMPAPWDDVLRADAWVAELAASLKPDVVHLNEYSHGDIPFGVPTVVVAHSCVPSWFEACRKQRAGAEWDRYRDEVGRGIHGADVVVAPTRAMLSALERHHGGVRHGRVIPNGRDPAAYGPGEKMNLIFSAGRLWDEAKNVAALEAIASQLPWQVVLAGEDHSAEAEKGDRLLFATDRSQRQGKSSLSPFSAIRLGRLPARAMAAWLTRTAIYCMPARYEPFGLSILEAAHARCALVLGDIESLRENWDGAAVFVDPEDREALKHAITDLIEDEPKRMRLAEVAQQRARRFTPQAMGNAYLALYEELLFARSEAADILRSPRAESRGPESVGRSGVSARPSISGLRPCSRGARGGTEPSQSDSTESAAEPPELTP